MERESVFEYGDPHIEWNEANEANADGQAVADAEREAAEADEEICGETYDHDLITTYDEPDGWAGECRRCGAELWEDRETLAYDSSDEHLAYNPHADRHETGGDEIEYAEEG